MTQATSSYLNKPLRSIEQAERDMAHRELKGAAEAIERMEGGVSVERGGVEIERLQVAMRDLIVTAKILYANSQNCVIEHYGGTVGQKPPWLRDCKRSIERAAAILEEKP